MRYVYHADTGDSPDTYVTRKQESVLHTPVRHQQGARGFGLYRQYHFRIASEIRSLAPERKLNVLY
jgi:hypothetical protein